MGRKKHPEHVNHERWLVSYADFITLLFAFFVVLFASGQSDKKKQQKFASAFQNAFSQMALFSPASKHPAIADSTGNNPNAEPTPIELPIQTEAAGDAEKQIEQVRQKIQKIITQQPSGTAAPALSMRKVPDGIALSLHEGGFFASGSTEIRPETLSTLDAIAASLSTSIRVEGHTDNQPIHSATYATNWELSTARASTIARYLLSHSQLDPAQLAVAGYAEFHPLATNTTPEGRAQNRRVDIVFLKPTRPTP